MKVRKSRRAAALLLSLTMLVTAVALDTPTPVQATEAEAYADSQGVVLTDNADNGFAHFSDSIASDGTLTAKAEAFTVNEGVWPEGQKLASVEMKFYSGIFGASNRYMLFIYDYNSPEDWRAFAVRETTDGSSFRYGFVENLGNIADLGDMGQAAETIPPATALGFRTGTTMQVDYTKEGSVTFRFTNDEDSSKTWSITKDCGSGTNKKPFYLVFSRNIEANVGTHFSSIEIAWQTPAEDITEPSITANAANGFRYFADDLDADGGLKASSKNMLFSLSSGFTWPAERELTAVEFELTATMQGGPKMGLIYDYTDANNYKVLHVRESGTGFLYMAFADYVNGVVQKPTDITATNGVNIDIAENSVGGGTLPIGFTTGTIVRIEYLSSTQVKFTFTNKSNPSNTFTTTVTANGGSGLTFGDNPFYLWFRNDVAGTPTFGYITMEWAVKETAPEETEERKVASADNQFGYFSAGLNADGRVTKYSEPFTYEIPGWNPSEPAVVEMKLFSNLITSTNEKMMHFIYDYKDPQNYKALAVRETQSGLLYPGFEELVDGVGTTVNTNTLITTGGVDAYGGPKRDAGVAVGFGDGALVKIEYLNEKQVRFTFTDVQDETKIFTTTVTDERGPGFGTAEFYLRVDTGVTETEFSWITVERQSAQSEFKVQFAKVLAMNPEMMVPYDLAEAGEMLAAYEALELTNGALYEEMQPWVSAYNAWDNTSPATAAESYRNIWGGKIATDTKEAWNVYQRLEKDVKELLKAEYAQLVAAFADDAANTEDIRIACLGDSITVGYGCTPDPGAPDASNYYYPNQLKKKLGAGYAVDIFGYSGMRVQNWDVNSKTPELVFAQDKGWGVSHNGTYDIVIIQLGTNDLSVISNNQGTVNPEKAALYERAFEELVMSYLRCENSPYVVVSNTPVSYNAVKLGYPRDAIAKINMKVAAKYGLPCVDMQSYTWNFMEPYDSSKDPVTENVYLNDNLHFTNAGYEKMAEVFYQAVSSFDRVFDTAEVTGFYSEESDWNHFLTPELYSATIKETSTADRQNLGFETRPSQALKTGASIVEYGLIFSRYSADRAKEILANMTLGNANNGARTDVFKACRFLGAGETLEDSYLMGVKEIESLGRVYVARAYVKYSDGSVYYSVNTREDLAVNDYAARAGVLKGYAVRSVISVAKSMVQYLDSVSVDVSSIAYVSGGTITWNVDTSTTEGVNKIFELIYENADTLGDGSISAVRN